MKMVAFELCPKCRKRQYYFRVAFNSWRCYACGYERENDEVKIYSIDKVDYAKKAERARILRIAEEISKPMSKGTRILYLEELKEKIKEKN